MAKPSRTWAEIDLLNVAGNVKTIRKLISPDVKLMCVVKADAYGHGVEGIVPVLVENGADMLAVASLDEGIQLREMGVNIPILILGYTDPERAEEVVVYGLSQTVSDHELAKALSDAAGTKGCRAVIHVKVDTGMGRFGITAGSNDVEQISEICALPGLDAEGIFTHFAVADSDENEYTEEQFAKFTDLIERLSRSGISFRLRHACNSAGMLKFPGMHLDMVRPGILLYGISPASSIDISAEGFKPVMTLKSGIAMIKDLKRGSSVSYGRKYIAYRDTKTAVISIGYADGYLRALSDRSEVLINGRRYPVIGTICMDACIADISDSAVNISSGDEVVLIGCSGDEMISVDELADKLGSISYEVVCTIGRRVPRVFISPDGKRKVRNMLLDNGVLNDIGP
jgi:alanine racemase